MKEINKYNFSVYMDWWVTQKAWELTNKPYYELNLMSFKEFCSTKTKQTGKTFLNEWLWKWGERF